MMNLSRSLRTSIASIDFWLAGGPARFDRTWHEPRERLAAGSLDQRRVYAGRYRYFRALHDFLRYDGRYRLFLMEELFRAHDIPFERQRVFELGFGTGFAAVALRHDVHLARLGDLGECRRVTPQRPARGELRGSQLPGRPARRHPDLSGYRLRSGDRLACARTRARRSPLPELLAERTRPDGYGLFFLPLERPRHNPDHARTYTAAGFSRLLQAAGFTPVHVSENFRYGSHLVQVINWPSRARIPLLGHVVEALKTLLLALPPTSFVRLVEQPLARLHVAPYQLMVLAQKRASSFCSHADPCASTSGG